MAIYPLDDTMVEKLTTSRSQAEVYDANLRVGGSFGVRVSSRGRKAFFVVFPLNGRRKRMTLGYYPLITVTEARRRALDALHQAHEGRDPAAERRLFLTSESFKEIAELYLREHVSAKSPKTAAEYRRLISKELLPFWQDRKIRGIEASEITQFVHQIASKRGAPVLGARVRAVLSSIFTFAVNRGMLKVNPISAVKPLVARPSRERILSIDELRGIFKAIELESPRVRAFFVILILTGQRIGKILTMRWADVRVDLWDVPSSGRHRQGFPVHLVPQVVQALRELQLDSRKDSYIFHAPKGQRMDFSRAVARLNKLTKGAALWNALDIYRSFNAGLFKLGCRPDLIDVIQQRRAPRIGRFATSFNYSSEAREALIKWARVVVPPPGGRRASNVISLFR